MILVEGIRCDVFQCLSYRWKRRKDMEEWRNRKHMMQAVFRDTGGWKLSGRDRNVYWKRLKKRIEPFNI